MHGVGEQEDRAARAGTRAASGFFPPTPTPGPWEDPALPKPADTGEMDLTSRPLDGENAVATCAATAKRAPGLTQVVRRSGESSPKVHPAADKLEKH